MFFLALHAFRWALAGGARFEGAHPSPPRVFRASACARDAAPPPAAHLAVDDAFTESSLVYDATLALSVGGAGGCFVFTEQALASNPLTSVFGVTDATPPLAGAVRAGAAYAVGFMAVQAVQVWIGWAHHHQITHRASFVMDCTCDEMADHAPLQVLLFPANTTWSDVRKKGREQLTKTRESVLLPYRTPFG